MSEPTVKIEAEVNPTEDPEKVKASIENIFTPSSIELIPQHRGDLLRAKATGREGLTKFYLLLRQERILSAARRILSKGTSGSSIVFCLNKQAAQVKRISFCEPEGESPLGPIRVEIESDEPKALIDWLAPRITE